MAADTPTRRYQARHSHVQSHPLWFTVLSLASKMHHYQLSTALRSSTTTVLHRPHASSDFYRHSFAVSAPAVWNNIPAAVRVSVILDTFKTAFKAHLFRPHRSTTYIDAAHCYRPSIMVCRSVTVVTMTKNGSTARDGVWVVDSATPNLRNHVLGRVHTGMTVWRIPLSRSCASAMQPVVKLL